MLTLRAAVGRRLKSFRKASDLTQEELARRVGIDVKYVGDLETGRKAPSFEVLDKVLRVLDVEPSEFFAFSLRERKGGLDCGQGLLSDMVARCDPSAQRLLLALAKGVLRWHESEKK